MVRALVICGPTSSGKSEIALAVAEQLSGEIVNADSRQIYRGMNIGTGAPSPAALERVPHHLYAFVDPAQRYSAARYIEDASNVIETIATRGGFPIVVGGTGFYIEALTGTMRLDRPPGDEELRARLRTEATVHPPDVLWDWLATLSGSRAAETRRGDSYRTLRALESELTRRSERLLQSPRAPARIALACDVAVLHVDRHTLRVRIAQRVREMFEAGLIAEARSVRAVAAHAPALSGLGYAEALAFVDGLATRDEALASAIRRTERYAKRQETWFRRMRAATVVDADDRSAAIRAIVEQARETQAKA